ncbi:Phosphotransferase enzyme family protein [Nonomuraea coxensis DSM 45129]|uniref:Phosphotransferase enzyme family protein n=1 Tax=Nonomuraea coxensis DSM 45129 TaxID=1122611 RepID=A0ABX8U7D9_9ACTN|nr:phosphotransferase [Nonomuraea coxensis]QYC42674.1 Phosphotransferase enzyme family protein [Nonomuraea coxensis DSM 45129]
MHVGSLIASGCDCEIFEAGPGRVVRRARDGRSLEREAAVMRHARRHGFPAPEVFDADGPDILMERVNGPSLMAEAVRVPERAPEHGRLLASLLRALARVQAPGWLQAAPGGPGNRLLHLDLHPANVLLTPDGPRVVDWANAARGAAGADVACTWLVLATAPLEASMDVWRSGMLAAFLAGVDTVAARRYLPAVADRRRAEEHLSAAEKAEISAFLARSPFPDEQAGA